MDDEVFIRSIVNTVSDLPRLVYADWLDEREDPRGVYLRFEVEWMRTWAESTGAPDPAPLLEMARDLDSLWVLRTSRPPFGVSCPLLLPPRWECGGWGG
jgi:uncharacterized protein (TIGR02996 family)